MLSKSLIFATLISTVLFVAQCAVIPQQVPLVQNLSSAVSHPLAGLEAFSHLNALLAKNNKFLRDIGQSIFPETPDSESFFRSRIIVDAEIGTPAQKQKIELNFVGGDLWVVGDEYDKSSFIANPFAPENSTSFKKTTDTWDLKKFSTFKPSGYVGKDTVVINGHKIEKQIVKIAEETSAKFPMYGVNGILGLATDSEGVSTIKQLFNKESFTIANTPVHGNPDLYITFTDKDNGACKSEWSLANATDGFVWRFNIYGVSTEKNKLAEKNEQSAAFFDSLDLTYVPDDVLDEIVEFTDAKALDVDNEIYQVTCNLGDLPTLRFSLEAKKSYVLITPENYIIKIVDRCYLKLGTTPEETKKIASYIFSTPVFRSNCIKINGEDKTVSFAGLSDPVKKSGSAAVTASKLTIFSIIMLVILSMW